MPLYLYKICGEDSYFEVQESMTDQPLEFHPETGAPVRRVITAPGLILKHSSGRTKDILSEKNIADKGFTQYRKVESGVYERTAGDGPPMIYRPSSG